MTNHMRLKRGFITVHWAILIVGLALAVFGWMLLRLSRQQEYRIAFSHTAEHAWIRLSDRLRAVEEVVCGAELLFSASSSITEQEWETMITRLGPRTQPAVTELAYCISWPRANDSSNRDGCGAEALLDQAADEPRPVRTVYSEPKMGEQARRRFESELGIALAGAVSDGDTQRVRLFARESEQDKEGARLFVAHPVQCAGVSTDQVTACRWIVAAVDLDELMNDPSMVSAGCHFRLYDGTGGAPRRLWPPPGADEPSPEMVSGWLGSHGESVSVVFPLNVDHAGMLLEVEPGEQFHVTYRTPNPELFFLLTLLGTAVVGGMLAVARRCRRRAEAQRRDMWRTLEETEGLYRSVFDSAMDGIVILDQRLRIVNVNPAAAAIHGYQREELLQQPLERFVTAGVYRAVVQLPRLLKRRGVVKGRVESTTKDGRLRYLSVHVSLLRLSGEMCYLINFSDCTQQRKSQRQLHSYTQALKRANVRLQISAAEVQRAAQARSEFLAHMSHEIRSPLTAIIGYAEMLCRQTSPGGETGEADGNEEGEKPTRPAWIIHRNSEYLLQLVNEFLDFSKLEAGQLKIEPTAVSPLDPVREVCELLRSRAVSKGIDLRMDVCGKLPTTIHTDSMRLRQILINLVDNAIKFTSEGSVTVRVGLWEPGGDDAALAFEVIDTGVGIPADQQDRLFRPFVQAHTATARQFGGTGLGLAISRELSKLMGGLLKLDSQPGKGTKFTLLLPIDSGQQHEKQPPATQGGEVSEEARRGAESISVARTASERLSGRVLLAEDSTDNRRLFRLMLQRAGIEVAEAADGRQAVEYALSAKPPFDLILMDVQMPEVDGLSATRELRSGGYRWPVVALTANNSRDDRAWCLEAGCDDYMAKPVRRDALLEIVRKYLTITPAETDSLCSVPAADTAASETVERTRE